MSLVAAFVVTNLAIWMLTSSAAHLRLLEPPIAQRRHDRATPIVGGLGMFAGATAGWAWLASPITGLVLASGVAVGIGLWDDVRPLSHYIRFGGQIAAAGLMVGTGGVVLTELGTLTSEAPLILGNWAVPITIFAAIGVMNAVNMSDGIDGLAGSLCLLAIGCVSAMALVAGDWSRVAYLGPMAAALVVFLAYNLRIGGQARARVFMGDAGSLFLGLVMAWTFIDASQGNDRLITPVTALWLFALPLCDAVRNLIRRPIIGQSPFRADTSHYHHYLRACGLSVNQTLKIVLVTALVGAVIGMHGYYAEVPERFMFAGFLVWFTIYLVGMEYLARRLTSQPEERAY